MKRSTANWLIGLLAAIVLAGCGSSQHSSAGAGGAPLTLEQVESNLKNAGYKITVYTRGEGALQIDAAHTASAGISV